MSHHYSIPCSNHFWTWEEKGTVLTVKNGPTIAYKPFVADILEKLAPQGLPLFPTLLLALVATNPNAEEELLSIKKNLKNASDDEFNFLDKLSKLPNEYKVGEKRLWVMQAVFQDCHYILSKKNSLQIAQRFSMENHDVIDDELSIDSREKYLIVLGVLNKKFETTESIIDRVGQLLEFEEEIILPQLEEVPEDFVEELSSNEVTYKVGRLIKSLWAGLRLPVHSSVPSQQPIGGVSDLTNKGSFDQLLISEFANDDWMFLSRLANNEMLYLNRESPPARNTMKRTLLIDVSLKGWGTPKILAFSTLVAIASHPKTDIICEAYAVGGNYQPLRFGNVDEVIEGLQVVDTSLNASEGIIKLLEQHPEAHSNEIFLLVEKSTMKHPNMVRLSQQFGSLINYWMLNDAKGAIDVYKNLARSKKHVQQLRLPVEKLWGTAPRKSKNKSREVQDELPSTYPILVKRPMNCKAIKRMGMYGVFAVSINKDLIRQYEDGGNQRGHKGWDLVARNVPVFNHSFEIGQSGDGTFFVLGYDEQKKEMVLMNLDTQQVQNIPFPEWEYNAEVDLYFDGFAFYHINSKGVFKMVPKKDEGFMLDDGLSDPSIDDVISAHQTNIAISTRRVTHNILKKLTSVGVGDDDHLYFNAHRLHINKSDFFEVGNSMRLQNAIYAKEYEKNKFEFADGSTVVLDKLGMFTLLSSNSSIPIIHIPSVLNKSLGVATNEDFAGIETFYKGNLYRIVVTQLPQDRENFSEVVLKAYRLMMKKHQLELPSDAEEQMESIGKRIKLQLFEGKKADLGIQLFKQEAKNFLRSISTLGVDAQIEKVHADYESPAIVSSKYFNQEYIKPFIQNIISHVPKA